MRGLLGTLGSVFVLLFCFAVVSPVAADLTTGLVSYWSFDNPADPGRDYSPGGNEGTIYGATWTSAGRVGGALSFDGLNDWVRISQTFPFHPSTDATLAFWMNKSDNYHRAIFWTRSDSSDINRFNIYANYGSYGFGLDYRAANGALHDIGRIGGFSSDQWVHIAVARAGNTYTLYRDGSTIGSYTDSSPALPTTIGAWSIGNRSGYMYKGLLDEILLYDRCLSAGEIGQLASGVQPVPLPGAVALAVLGLTAASWRLRRKTV